MTLAVAFTSSVMLASSTIFTTVCTKLFREATWKVARVAYAILAVGGVGWLLASFAANFYSRNAEDYLRNVRNSLGFSIIGVFTSVIYVFAVRTLQLIAKIVPDSFRYQFDQSEERRVGIGNFIGVF